MKPHREKGDVQIWFSGVAVTAMLLMTLTLVGVILVRGLRYFWVNDVIKVTYVDTAAGGQDTHAGTFGTYTGTISTLLGEPSTTTLRDRSDAEGNVVGRAQENRYKKGNRDLYGEDFHWVLEDVITETEKPEDVYVIERLENGNFYGFFQGEDLKEALREVRAEKKPLDELKERTGSISYRLSSMQKNRLKKLQYKIEKRRKAGKDVAALEEREKLLLTEIDQLQKESEALSKQAAEEEEKLKAKTATFKDVYGTEKQIALIDIVRIYQPNKMGVWAKSRLYAAKVWEVVSTNPREANSEGGIFPALYGTVMMVIIMSIFVMPFGVIAAIYLREYAREGTMVRAVRIAVNNLAGVPSIVYGIFGLGFFIYILGGDARCHFLPLEGAGHFRDGRHPLGQPHAGRAHGAGGDRRHRGGAGRDPARSSRGFTGARRHQVPDGRAGAAADGLARDPHRLHPLDGSRRGRGRPAHADRGGEGDQRAALPGQPRAASRSEVHASGIPHLRRRIPESQRRGHDADGLRDHAAAAGARHPDEYPRHRRAKPYAQEIYPGSLLMSDEAQVVEAEEAPAADYKAVISVSDFNLWYGESQALFDINMRVPAGKVTAFIGPSGCGKSTLLRCFNRMNDLIDSVRTSGDIVLSDERITSSKTDVIELRRNVGMVFQKSNPFPKSIFENVVYGLRISGVNDRTRLEEVCEDSLKRAALWDEVKDRLKDSAFGLSGGQQQRLCIARAVAVQPDIILMDEPCSALDPRSTAKIEDLIKELQGDFSIVIVTHNMQQASRVSNYTAFLYEGKLVEFGVTGDLFTRPRQKATEDYITGRFG